MKREPFEELCHIIRNDLMKQETRMEKPVSVEKRVAVGLWRLSTGNSYQSCELQEDYFNRKQYYSINLQRIVNPQVLFQHIATGFPT